MTWRQVQRFAFAHSRLRARLSQMPDHDRWRYIASGGDLDAVIQRLRDNGLGRWVLGLPRNPDIDSIDQALLDGLIGIAHDIGAWLPGNWTGVRRWLEEGVTVALIRRLLRNHIVRPPQHVDPLLLSAAQAPLEQRTRMLTSTRYARYLTPGVEDVLDRWLDRFDAIRPPSYGREAYVIARLKKLITSHLYLITQERARWRRPGDTSMLNPDTQWRLRGDFEKSVRDLLSGESFHAGALLVYGVLELLQFERTRALLTARRYSWAHARFA